MEKKYGALSSSYNPQELAMRVKGAMLSVTTIVVFIAAHFGMTILPAEWSKLAENISNFMMVSGQLYSLGMIIFGQIRAMLVKQVTQ